MRLEFDIYEFLRRQLPHHKRQVNRLGLFYWALRQIEVVWNEFKTWRTEMVYQINVTGQKLSLIDFLNRKIPGANNGISIIETSDGGIYLSTMVESIDFQYMSIMTENSDVMQIPLNGEMQTALEVDFQVKVPAGVNTDLVNTIMKRYILAGKDYEIIN